MVSSLWCDDWGDLEFEKFWSKRCDVMLFHFTPAFKGNVCKQKEGKSFPDHPRLIVNRTDMWGGRTFNGLYKVFPGVWDLQKQTHKYVDVLKIQKRGAWPSDEFDGVQFTVLADIFLHHRDMNEQISQVAMISSFTPSTLVDSVGREAEHAWNMWATQRFLASFAAFNTVVDPGPFKEQPRQFDELLRRAALPADVAYYHHSFVRVRNTDARVKNDKALAAWKPVILAPLLAKVPLYCTVPSPAEDRIMQAWILHELRVRCHATRLHVPCEFDRQYDAFIPCEQELMDNLAEDYAASKNWCDFNAKAADILPLQIVDPGAYKAFKKPLLKPGGGVIAVRLAFIFTVYADAPFVERLFSRLYSEKHYYLFHVDPAGASAEFERGMRVLCAQYTNVFISKDIPIVYGAATATVLLTRSMAWFSVYATGWDYMVPVTGSDYPLMPLDRFEKILYTQKLKGE